MRTSDKFLQLFIAADQLAGTIVGLFLHNGAWADETLSARAWREHKTSKGWERARRFIDRLFFWQTDHCQTAYISERLREHMPIEYRPVDE